MMFREFSSSGEEAYFKPDKEKAPEVGDDSPFGRFDETMIARRLRECQ